MRMAAGRWQFEPRLRNPVYGIDFRHFKFELYRKRIFNFLLVINRSLGTILPRFRDIAVFLLKQLPHPYFTRILGTFPCTRLVMLRFRGAYRL